MAAYTLDIDSAAFTLTGFAVGTSRGRFVAVARGEFLLYSQSVTLQEGTSVPVAAGAFALSGQAVDLVVAKNVARGTFTLGGQSVQFTAPGSVTYATIVDGIVTSVDSGALPPSTNDTLYFDLTGFSTPSVGWYFSEVCQTFSATIPVAPPGTIAPPFVPGGLPPVIDDPGGDGPADEEGPDIRSPVLPDLITWAADADGLLTIPAVPEAETSLGNKYHVAYDFTEVCYLRLQAEVITPASSGAILKLQYFDGVEWIDLQPVVP